MTDLPSRLASAGAALAALSLPALAQQTSFVAGGPMNAGFYELGMGEVTPDEIFRHTVLGEFTGDGLVDVVIRREDTCEMMIDPGLFEARISGFGVATTIAKLPPAHAGQPDLLAMAGPQGLQVLSWTGEAPSFWLKDGVGSARWASATRIRVAELEGDTVIVGLESDSRTFLRVVRIDGEWFELPMFTSGSSVVDFELFEFNGEAPPEIGVITPTGIEVLSLHGERLAQNYQWPVTSAALARITDHDDPLDRLAWVVTGPFGLYQYLGTFGAEGLVPQVTFLGNPGIVAVTSGDVDDDGDDDLHLSYQAAEAIAVTFDIRDTEPTPVYRLNVAGAAALHNYGPAGTAAPLNEAWPAVGDLDNDRDLDFCLPVQSRSTVFIHKGDTVDERTMQPRAILDDETELAEIELSGEHGGTFDLSITLQVQTPFPEGATHVEIFVLTKPDVNTPTESEYETPVLVPLPEGMTDVGVWETTVVVPLPEDVPAEGEPSGFDTIYMWVQRLVKRGVERNLAVFPHAVYGLEATRDDEEEQAFLLGVSTNNVSYQASYVTGSEDDGVGSALQRDDEITTVNELQCLPDLPDDEPPKPKAPQTPSGT